MGWGSRYKDVSMGVECGVHIQIDYTRFQTTIPALRYAKKMVSTKTIALSALATLVYGRVAPPSNQPLNNALLVRQSDDDDDDNNDDNNNNDNSNSNSQSNTACSAYPTPQPNTNLANIHSPKTPPSTRPAPTRTTVSMPTSSTNSILVSPYFLATTTKPGRRRTMIL